MRFTALLFFLSVISAAAATVAPPQPDPVAAASALLTRLLGPSALPLFRLEAIPADPATGLDVFEADSDGPLVVLRGNTGVALSTALNNYLKYSLNASVSWGRNFTGVLVTLPPVLPLPQRERTTMVKWRYSWNVCAPGYSFVWYSAEQWRFMIDWMALQGVNLPLAFNGQEYVFAQAFKALGLTDPEIWAFLSGPAFAPWNRMGNMQGWGARGPGTALAGLDWDWMAAQRDLQLTIVGAMRELGMTPVLPGFAGHVPSALQRVLPDASFTHSSDWCGFNSTFGSVALLEPTDPSFVTVGSAINKAVLAAFGDPSGAEVPYFNADTVRAPPTHKPLMQRVKPV